MSSDRRPLLIVVSAPSGAGKSTLCERLLAERDDIVYSVSCTTRPPRGQEVDGVDYFFLSEAEFEARAARGEFLEHARVHGRRYGTLRRTVEDAFRAGKSVLMDIDVQGASQIRENLRAAPAGDPLKRGFIDIFIEPPSPAELRARLVKRAEDAPEEIDRRLRVAEEEMRRRGEYKVRIVNDDLNRAYREFAACLERTPNLEPRAPP